MDRNSPPRLAFEYVAPLELMILYQVSSAPSDQEWGAYLNAVAEVLAVPELRFLSVTEGGYPTRVQRERMRARVTSKGYRMAVLTNHATVRFVVSAAALFNPNIKAFATEESVRKLFCICPYLKTNTRPSTTYWDACG